MSTKHWIAACLMLTTTATSFGQELPGQVELKPARWRAVRQIIQAAADQTGFRWAMPAPISRRAFVGAADPIRTAALLQDTCKQTGLTLETIAGIQVFHIPRNEERQRLLGLLSDGGKTDPLQAIAELGWLPDARAWPELAKVAVGRDTKLALAAAQALRRLDGEKSLDWRMWGVTDSDPELVDVAESVPIWQVPLGRAFPDAVTLADVEKLSRSPYIPLREAAARLTAALGSKQEPGRKVGRGSEPHCPDRRQTHFARLVRAGEIRAARPQEHRREALARATAPRPERSSPEAG